MDSKLAARNPCLLGIVFTLLSLRIQSTAAHTLSLQPITIENGQQEIEPPQRHVHLNASFNETMQTFKKYLMSALEDIVNRDEDDPSYEYLEALSSGIPHVMPDTLREISEQLSILSASKWLDSSDKLSMTAVKTSADSFLAYLDTLTEKEEQQNEDEKYTSEENIENIFIPSSWKNFKRELELVQKAVEQLENEEVARRLPGAIVQAIKSNRFAEAEQKLKPLDYSIYKYIVHEVYNNQADNFDLLIRFGDSMAIYDKEGKFEIYNALYNEIKVNGHDDIWKQFRLRKSIKKEILDGTFEAIAAISLYDTLWIKIQETVVIPSIASILHDGPAINLTNDGCRAHFGNDWCFQCMIEICGEMINKLWNKLSIVDIFARARNNLKNIDLQIAFQVAAFHQIQQGSEEDTSNNALTLARHMKFTMDDPDYHLASSEMRAAHEDVKRKLPSSLRNLVFSSAVCVKHIPYKEYLYAGSSDYHDNDHQRRRVFTSTQGTIDKASIKWIMSFVDIHRLMMYNYQNGEYLYSEFNGWPVTPFDDNREHVSTWVSNETDHQIYDPHQTWSMWDVEVTKGGGIHFKNHFKTEYLVADCCLKYGENNKRQVFTLRSKMRDRDSTWEIIDCSNS